MGVRPIYHSLQVLVTTHQALAVLMRHELSTPIAHTGSSQLLPTCHLVLHYDLLAAPLVDLRAHGQLMSLVGAEEVLLMREKDNIGQDIHLEVYLRMIGRARVEEAGVVEGASRPCWLSSIEPDVVWLRQTGEVTHMDRDHLPVVG